MQIYGMYDSLKMSNSLIFEFTRNYINFDIIIEDVHIQFLLNKNIFILGNFYFH